MLIDRILFQIYYRYYDLQPLAGELYNGSDASYYSVAIIRSASDVTKLSELRGNRNVLYNFSQWNYCLSTILFEFSLSFKKLFDNLYLIEKSLISLYILLHSALCACFMSATTIEQQFQLIQKRSDKSADSYLQ